VRKKHSAEKTIEDFPKITEEEEHFCLREDNKKFSHYRIAKEKSKNYGPKQNFSPNSCQLLIPKITLFITTKTCKSPNLKSNFNFNRNPKIIIFKP